MVDQQQEARDLKRLDPVISGTVIVLVLAVVGYAVASVVLAPEISEDDIVFEPLQVDRDRLLEERKERASDVQPERAGDDLERLRESARQANEMSFQSSTKVERETLNEKLSVYANQIMPAYGYDGFVYSAEPLFIECGKGLEELLDAVQRGQISIDDANQDLPEDTFERYRKNCGNVLPMLVEQGLVTEEGEWSVEAGPAIFDVLNRYRWAHIIDDRRRAIMQLTPYEREILMRWRIEDAEAFDNAERWRFLEQARGLLDDYNVAWAAGVLSMRDGNLEQALDYFQKAADAGEPEEADKVVDYLEQRLANPDEDS